MSSNISKKLPIPICFQIALLIAILFISDHNVFVGTAIQKVAVEKRATQGEGYQYKKSNFDYIDNLVKGRDGIRKLYNKSAKDPKLKDAGLRNWDFIGPANIGGKVKTLVTVPNESNPAKEDIIIGAASGGILKSTDEGASWFAVDDFMASLSITNIVVHPNNPDTLYAASGDGFGGLRRAPGAGIFRSIDRGNSWEQLTSTNNSDFILVNRLAIDSNNPDIIFAVTTIKIPFNSPNGKIWRSINGGETWSSVASITDPMLDIKIDPYNSNIILAGGDNSAYRSSNGGTSFSLVSGGPAQLPSSPERVEIAFAPATNGLVFASLEKSDGELWKSTNSGLNWVAINTSTAFLSSQGWHNNAIWIDPLNSNSLLVGGVDVFRSTTGGSTLTKISQWQNYSNNSPANSLHGDQHAFYPSLFYSNSNPKVYIANDGGVQMTNNIWTADLTSGWTNLANTTLGVTQVIGAAVSKSGSVFSVGTQDNNFSTGSTQSNWFQWTTGDGGHCAIDQTNDNTIYNTSFGKVYKSTDGGANYTFNHQVNNVSYGFPFGMDKNNSQILLAGNEVLWSSLNAGTSWVQIKSDSLSTTYGHAFITAFDSRESSNSLWVGYNNGAIERRYPGTSTWSGDLRNIGTMPAETVTSIAVNPSNPAEVVVTFAGYHTNHIWYSPDYGINWYNRSLDFPMQVNYITWHPSNSNWLYIGTDFGVLSTEDKGNSWSLYPIYPSSQNTIANDGPVYTIIFQLFWQGDGSANYPYYLCAASYGRGIWRSSKPILNRIYIDRYCTTCGLGTFSAPYQTFRQAVNEAGLGTTLVFLSSGLHNEIPADILVDKRFKIEIANSSVIIE